MHFHLLSFEGPDDYARAGGIATRITGLAHALADAGYETHLWFVGDPNLPGHETHAHLHLHRWCQWISRYHPAGVYDGEERKRWDYTASLPSFLCQEVLLPHLQQGGRALAGGSNARAGRATGRPSDSAALYLAPDCALHPLASIAAVGPTVVLPDRRAAKPARRTDERAHGSLAALHATTLTCPRRLVRSMAPTSGANRASRSRTASWVNMKPHDTNISAKSWRIS